MKTTTNIFLIIALSLLTLTAYADTTVNTNVTGNYTCQRTDSSNNTSSLPLSVIKTGDTYTLEWDDSDGNPSMYGTGVIHPGMANVLSSSYWSLTSSDISGLEIFTIKPDGSLQADWISQSGKDSGSETCKKSK
jgi:hypothetical protein